MHPMYIHTTPQLYILRTVQLTLYNIVTNHLSLNSRSSREERNADWPTSHGLFPRIAASRVQKSRMFSLHSIGSTTFVRSAKSVRRARPSQKCPAAVICLTTRGKCLHHRTVLLRGNSRDRGGRGRGDASRKVVAGRESVTY